jgi:hypothetical protein
MHEQLPSQLTDPELVAEVARLASSERRTTAALIEHLAELDARRIHLRAGYESLFVYCTQVLRLSEGGAYNRIVAARSARRFPAALERLAEGELNLATLRLVAPHLTAENQEELLALAAGKSKRELQEALARRFPKPEVAASVRKLPARRPDGLAPGTLVPSLRSLESGGGDEPGGAAPGGRGIRTPSDGACGAADGADLSSTDGPKVPAPAPSSTAVAVPCAEQPRPSRHPVVLPLSPDRYQFRFTGSAATRDKLRKAQDLLRHAVPSGDPGEIFDRALTALLKEVERKKFAASDRPREPRDTDSMAAGSRVIPAAVKRAVKARDGSCCGFVGDAGRRCGATAFLEFHHVVPWARGGPATADNIQLRCRGHNGYEAELDFGRRQLVPGQVERTGARLAAGVIGEQAPVKHREPDA